MINYSDIIVNFRKEFEKMSPSEQKAFLKESGFVFVEKTPHLKGSIVIKKCENGKVRLGKIYPREKRRSTVKSGVCVHCGKKAAH